MGNACSSCSIDGRDCVGDVATGEVAVIVELRARESCIAMSASIVLCRSRTSGSCILYDLERVGDKCGLAAGSISLFVLVLRRTGE